MTTDERLEKLEQRLTVLEGLVRQLLAQSPLRRSPAGDLAADPPRPTPPPREPVVQPVTVPPPAVLARDPEKASVDSEQWFGQRGLLAVGVIFLILAAGYLLKLSFERGWISPAARCTGGALAGLMVGALGYRLHRKGLATYGAALIGCGAAIVYLAVWAASRLYQFLPPTSGVLGLALVSLSLAAIAFVINVEALGATAALGAFFAPLLLGSSSSDANILLLYLGFMGVSLGWVAAARRWRLTILVVAASYFGLVSAEAWEYANPNLLLLYGLFGGCAGLYLGLREQWWETRIIGFTGGWGLLGLANQNLTDHWPVLAGAIVLAAPIWWRALRSNQIWPATETDSEPAVWSPGESFYFYLTPVLLGWALYQIAPDRFDRNEGLLPAIVALPYLIAGFTAVRIRFAVVGTTAVLIAMLFQWPGLEAVWGLLIAGVLWAGLDHVLEREDGRWYGLLAVGVALAHLMYHDLEIRSASDPAFVGSWPVLLWAGMLVLTLFAAGLWRATAAGREDPASAIPGLCWTIAGLILLLGVTAEVQRYFAQSGLPPEAAALRSGLTVSAWWIVFAAGLILLGFRRNRKNVRIAGLVVSALAVLKVVLFDLSTLDALYRVGSVLILGIVSLGLAYIYHQRGRESGSA